MYLYGSNKLVFSLLLIFLYHFLYYRRPPNSFCKLDIKFPFTFYKFYFQKFLCLLADLFFSLFLPPIRDIYPKRKVLPLHCMWYPNILNYNLLLRGTKFSFEKLSSSSRTVLSMKVKTDSAVIIYRLVHGLISKKVPQRHRSSANHREH